MRRAGALLLTLALAAAPLALAAAPPKKAVPLDVKGDTVTIIKSFPVTVTAQAGADLYLWNVPESVKATSEDNVLTVTAAPKGSTTVSVVSLTIEFAQDDKGKITKKITKDRGSVTLNVGDVPGPKPPGPPGPPEPPGPDGELAKSLADALGKDADADKLGLARKLGGMYRAAAAGTVSDSGLKTVGDLDAVVRKTAQDLIGKLTVPNVRDAVGAYLSKACPTKKDAALDDATRQKFRAAYVAAADALEGLK